MKALVWHGEEDIHCDTVSNPTIEHARHAINVMSCAICGSDATTHAPRRRNRIRAGHGITLLDIAAYVGVEPAHRRKQIDLREHSNRSGWPQGGSSVSRTRPQGHQDAAGRPGRVDHRLRISNRLGQASPAGLPPVKLEADRRIGAIPDRKQE